MKKSDDLIEKIFFKKYKILKKIGKGSFGLVYMGQIINSDNYVAVKFESKNQAEKILERESYLLYYLKGFGIPEVITYGHNSKYNILVQTLLGISINDIFHSNNKKICMKDCCMIGIQMLDRLEYIHSKYIIHRDIKPDNFLVGNPDTSLIYLIDFGLSKKYMSSRTGRHVKFAINKKWSGTSRFASANSLRGVIQSRRDDLESLCYILLFIMKGNLPWDNVFGYSENDDILLIYKIKKFMKPELLFLNLPKETAEFFRYCKGLDFEQKPDYNYLRSLLLKILNTQKNKNDLNFSWIITYSNNFNNKREIANNQHHKISKRKNSPQQRIYNSLISNNKIKISKRSESFNELYLKDEVNKVRRNCNPIKNISPSPTKTNNLFKDDKKEINKNKFKYIRKIPNGRKKINISNNISNNFLKENIIIKTQTETERTKNKKINIIPLQKFGNKFFLKKTNESSDKNIIIFKKGSYLNKSTYNIQDVYNKNENVIKKNNSYNLNDIEQLNILKIPNIKRNKRFYNNNEKIQVINTDKNEDKYNYNIKYNRLGLENHSYNGKKNYKKNPYMVNPYLNDLKKNININIIQNNNFDNDKIYSENFSFDYKNNKILIPKNLRINHISPEQINRFKLKINSETNSSNNFKLNKRNHIKYKNNQIKLNLGKNSILNNFNIIKNNKTYINNQNMLNEPQKNIKIINIISPISKISNYYKVKKNSFSSKTNLYKTNEIIQLNSSNNKNITNKYYNRNKKNDLLYDYYSNSSVIDKTNKSIQQERIFPMSNNYIFNYEHLNNQIKDRILKTSSCSINKKLNVHNRNIINLNKNLISGSFSYISPKSIEKYKTKY